MQSSTCQSAKPQHRSCRTYLKSCSACQRHRLQSHRHRRHKAALAAAADSNRLLQQRVADRLAKFRIQSAVERVFGGYSYLKPYWISLRILIGTSAPALRPMGSLTRFVAVEKQTGVPRAATACPGMARKPLSFDDKPSLKLKFCSDRMFARHQLLHKAERQTRKTLCSLSTVGCCKSTACVVNRLEFLRRASTARQYAR